MTARRSNLLTLGMLALLIYFLLPLFWLAVASTKNTESLFSTFGLWFAGDFSLFSNIKETLTYADGVYLRWMLNTLFYSLVSAGGAAFLAAMGGYGFAKYRFRGNNALFALVLGSIMVPTTALAIPTYLLFSKVGMVNTPWAIILPSLVSPFGLYLMRVYAQDAVPDTLIEAGRIDGASELSIFFRLALRSLAPGIITVLLFTLVATWNNYFLPLIMLNDPDLYPITVGLAAWSSQSAAGGSGSTGELLALVITGAALSIIPLIAAFLLLQRYWQSGLSAGGVKE
ncbi:carbohydrate ABC transporter permease [Actinoplanes sp. NPDC000266]